MSILCELGLGMGMGFFEYLGMGFFEYFGYGFWVGAFRCLSIWVWVWVGYPKPTSRPKWLSILSTIDWSKDILLILII